MHRNDHRAALEVGLLLTLAALVALVCWTLAGCAPLSLLPRAPRPVAASTEVAPGSPACMALDRAHLAWLVTSVVASGAGGSSSVAGLFASSPGRYIAVGASAAVGLFGLAAGVVAGHEAALFTADGCGASAP